jgi:hypothetical protein
MRWFANNEMFPVVERSGKQKVITNYQLKEYEQKGYRKVDNVKYDIMHLVLTVPHTINGWNGKIFYFREIKEKFNFMRKEKDWLKWVFGGEYGIENTRDKNGYHIHIHSLLFVRKYPKNRNRLHLIIFRIWNRITTDSGSSRKAFTGEEIKAIKEGNTMINNEYIGKLNTKGATIIHLSNIYFFQGKNRKKIYWADEWNSEAMLKAVMETISYHFKPKMFFETETSYDMDAITELLPEVYRLSLYSKFGCLKGEKSLNVNDNTLLEDYDETASDDLVDERTYFIGSPLDFYLKDEKIVQKRVSKNRIELFGVHTGRSAVEELVKLAYKKKTYTQITHNKHINN